MYYNLDHQGNIRDVVDATGHMVQSTHYYPFGMPISDHHYTINPELNTFKYNGKELNMMHGLNTYDYGARQYAPTLGRWDRMDPMCEKYYSVSPYAYCMNNPVNLFDPTGMVWEDPKEAELLKRNIENRIISLEKDIAKIQKKLTERGLSEKKVGKLQNKISEAYSRISNLNTSKADIDVLAADFNVYVLT